jgi:hypothetical protein
MNRFKIHNNCREFKRIIKNKLKEPIQTKVNIIKPFICTPYKLKKCKTIFYNKTNLFIRKSL